MIYVGCIYRQNINGSDDMRLDSLGVYVTETLLFIQPTSRHLTHKQPPRLRHTLTGTHRNYVNVMLI